LFNAWHDVALCLRKLAELSQPEGQGTRKINRNKLGNQKVSTTFRLLPLVYHMTLSGNSGRRLRWQGKVQLF
jgi:hypothetical protein